MTVVHRTALVPYTSQQMFELVNNIDAYPEFLQWCEKTDVHHRDEQEIKATLHLNWKGIKKSFTTLNRLETNKSMEMSLVDGPFKHLEGTWQFDSVEDLGCKVSVRLEFEFSQKLLNVAFSQVFEYIAGTLVDSFCKRAEVVYGVD